MGDAAPLQVNSKGRFERRVGAMTLIFGAVVALAAAVGHSPLAGVGVALGTLLAWLNLRWLDQAGVALARVAQGHTEAGAGGARPQIPQGTWVKFFARYALMALALYVTVTRSPVPPVSVVGGLLMLGAAAMAVGLYEVFGETR
jgi:ATP synthase I chain